MMPEDDAGPPRRGNIVLNVLGGLLSLAAIAFVAWTLVSSNALSSPVWRDPLFWIGVVGAAIVSALGAAGIALAWASLVQSLAPREISTLAAARIHATSQIYKYLPGNVLHYLGRHLLARRAGVSHIAGGASAIAEAALIAAAAACLAGLSGSTAFDLLPGWAIFLGALAVIVLLAAAMRSRAMKRLAPAALQPMFEPSARSATTRAFGLYLFFFLLVGVGVWIVARPLSELDLPACIAVGAGAWLLGFITPGAPAGVGVREAVMIASLSQLGTPAGDAALIATAYRVATIAADFALAGLARLMPPARAARS